MLSASIFRLSHCAGIDCLTRVHSSMRQTRLGGREKHYCGQLKLRVRFLFICQGRHYPLGLDDTVIPPQLEPDPSVVKIMTCAIDHYIVVVVYAAFLLVNSWLNGFVDCKFFPKTDSAKTSS